eukprot:4947011-Alexandrium_andersonii.AAC.1
MSKFRTAHSSSKTSQRGVLGPVPWRLPCQARSLAPSSFPWSCHCCCPGPLPSSRRTAAPPHLRASGNSLVAGKNGRNVSVVNVNVLTCEGYTSNGVEGTR